MLPATISRKARVEKTYQVNRNIHQSPNPWLYSNQKKKCHKVPTCVQTLPNLRLPISPQSVTKNYRRRSLPEPTDIEKERLVKETERIEQATKTEPERIEQATKTEPEIVEPEIVEPEIVEQKIVEQEIVEPELEITGYIGLAQEQQNNTSKIKSRQTVEFLRRLKSEKSSLFYSTKDGVTYITHNGSNNLYSANSKLYSF
jgi:hypothetical protein